MKISVLDYRSSFLNKVISLGEANKKKIGFFPVGAFKEQARQKKILIAHEKGKLYGYLLYGINQKELLAYIVHLCITDSCKQNGIANELIQSLRNKTKLLCGIRVHCRRDYNLSSFWSKCGFIAKGEKPGRGLNENTLTIWWMDYEQPSIFKYAENIKNESKVKAVIDANIFFELPNIVSEEVEGLFADWINEKIELMLTKEIYNEIDRNKCPLKRDLSRNRADGFSIVQSEPEEFKKFYQLLKKHYPEKNTQSNESDIRQLAHTIAAGTPFFITCDKKMLRKADILYSEFDIRVIRPSNFIILQDSLIREYEYQPEKIKGALISSNRVNSKKIERVISVFRETDSEKKSIFENRLNYILSKPFEFEVKIIEQHKKPIALIASKIINKSKQIVPLFRVVKDKLGATIAKHIAYQLVSQRQINKHYKIKITDRNLPSEVEQALIELGFIYTKDDSWVKLNLNEICSTEGLSEKISTYSSYSENHSDILTPIIPFIKGESSDCTDDVTTNIEKILFPLKIKNSVSPCFIVPIKPEWAVNLFDSSLAEQDLFGGNPHLLFNTTNVYYRSTHPNIMTAPGRILWYVSKGRGTYQNTMAIRACSYLDDVRVDKPKILYKKYKHLGVYTWGNVFHVAKNDINREIQAFTFSHTELFSNPIPKSMIDSIWRRQKKRNFNPQAPLLIDSELFFKLYQIGRELI